jgi:hypothetical protein
MWKPGASKPSPDDEQEKKAPEEPQNESKPSKKSPPRTHGLSGLTLNMRFMQRQKASGEQDEEKATPMDADESSSVEDDDDDERIRATPRDMFGDQALLLGRRSFGGFNRIVEQAWMDCYRSIRNEKSGKSASALSDKELLDRYEKLSNRKRQDRPIGNLDEKIKKKRRKSSEKR